MATTEACATVRSLGTFVPTECGLSQPPATSTESIPPTASASSFTIENVCIGRRVTDEKDSSDNRAAQFHLEDGRVLDFRVVSSTSRFIELSGGRSPVVFHLVSTAGDETTATLRAIVDARGHVLSATGTVGPVPFKVPALEPMFVIQ